MNVKIKKTHPDAVLPVANNKQTGTGDTGFDLVAVEDTVVNHRGSAVVPVGLTLADMTPGYWLRIEPRSGLGFKHSIQPHLGVIDNGYRGDLAVKLYNFSEDCYTVKKGDKIAQLAVYPLLQPVFEFTEDVTETNRGDRGFGSSDLSPDMEDIKQQVLRTNQHDHCQQSEDLFTKSKLDSGEYIRNPMKMDEGDPDYIKNPGQVSESSSDKSVSYWYHHK